MIKQALAALLVALPVCSWTLPAGAGDIVGLPAERLVACAGIPSAQMQMGDVTYWQYGASREFGTVQQFGQITTFGRGAVGCEATVTLKNGIVVSVQERRSGGFIGAAIQCAKLFSACGR